MTLVFDHYPKAAGSTVRRYLLRCFPLSQIQNIGYKPEHQKAFEDLPRDVRAQCQCVAHHSATRLAESIINPVWTTIIREPVSRAVSFHRYAMATPDMPGHEAARGMDVVEFAERHSLGSGLTRYFHSPHAMQDRYGIIGDTKDVAGFCHQLRMRFDLRVAYSHRRDNATHQMPILASARRKLESICSDDIEFYREIVASTLCR